MEYEPCTYELILKKVLSRPHAAGQGGHWEASADEATRALTRLTASCYSFLAKQIQESLGTGKAKRILRQAINHFGQYRGEAMRCRVESEGLPLDIPRLLDYWDLPSTEEAWTTENRIILPHYAAYEVPGCPFHDIYAQLCPPDLAILICEVVHVAVAKGFNPAMDVWYPALLTRGESKCVFRFSMPKEAVQKVSPEDGNKSAKGLADAATSYRLLARLHGLLYHFITDELLRTIGAGRTADLLKQAMHKWGTWRGEDIREAHVARGWPLSVENLIKYNDDPAAGDAWEARNVQLSASSHSKEIISSAYSTIFAQLGTGRFASIFFEEVLPAQAKAYNPSIVVVIPQLKERGDPVSQIRYITIE